MTPCVEHTQRGRYGSTHRRSIYGERVLTCAVGAYTDAHGAIPEGWEVDHLCFNPRCIRLDHLEAVPRLVNQRRRRNVRFTYEQVEALRRAYAGLARGETGRVRRGARQAFAAEHGLSVTHLKRLLERKVWAHA